MVRGSTAIGGDGSGPIRLVLPYPPSANRYWRNVKGVTLVSKEAKAYKEEVSGACLIARLKPISGSVAVRITIYRPRAVGDLDNCLKVLIDSLRGFAFADDSQIADIRATRRDDKIKPRAEVEIRPWQDNEGE